MIQFQSGGQGLGPLLPLEPLVHWGLNSHFQCHKHGFLLEPPRGCGGAVDHLLHELEIASRLEEVGSY